MSKRYTIDRSLVFDTQTGYWALTVQVVSATGVSPYPFLLEKAVRGTTDQNTLSTSQEEPQYLRTIIDSEVATTRTVNSDTTYDKYTWVQYVSNEFTKKYYTYEAAEEALASVLAILKSNAKVYSTNQVTPRLVVTNLSSKKRQPVLEGVSLAKGDTLSIQLVGGAGHSIVISDALFNPVSSSSFSATRRKSNSFVVTITDVSQASYIGIKDSWTDIEHTMPITVIPTPLEGTAIEVIK